MWRLSKIVVPESTIGWTPSYAQSSTVYHYLGVSRMILWGTTILDNPHVYTWFTLAEHGALPNEVAKKKVCKNIAQCPFWFGAMPVYPWDVVQDHRRKCSIPLAHPPGMSGQGDICFYNDRVAKSIQTSWTNTTHTDARDSPIHTNTESASKCQCLVNLRRCFKEDGVAFLGKLPIVQGFHLLHLQHSFPSRAGRHQMW